MSKPFSLALHIFRRDLRLHDNTALNEAHRLATSVIPCFIFDKRQIEKNNQYKSDNAIQFMVTSLQELNERLQEKGGKLYFFSGTAEDIVKKLLATVKVDAIFFNRDYTPFSRERDKKIIDIAEKNNISAHHYADALLHEPEEVSKINQQPYTIFTHFFKKASQLAVSSPQYLSFDNYYTKPISIEDKTMINTLPKSNGNIFVHGGRNEAVLKLKTIKKFADYEQERNVPALNATTGLSAHNKFGTISIREFYTTVVKAFNKNHTLIKELYWRDFFTHIAYHFPKVFGHSFIEKYESIPWQDNEAYYAAWCAGLTGFPIVDAGMRELNATGYMHNRVRMIVASFLTKDLHLDWRSGEKYFAHKLVDYDPAVNNGNWQWAASTGCDAQPYFRIFNPWLQQEKYDPECVYIKKWVPELQNVSPRTIHHWYEVNDSLTYPAPLIDHAIESKRAKLMYKNMT